MILVRFFCAFLSVTLFHNFSYSADVLVDSKKLKACYEMTDYKLSKMAQIDELPHSRFIGEITDENKNSYSINAVFFNQGSKLYILQGDVTRRSFAENAINFLSAPKIFQSYEFSNNKISASCHESGLPSAIPVSAKCKNMGSGPCLKKPLIAVGLYTNGRTNKSHPCKPIIYPYFEKRGHSKQEDVGTLDAKKLIEDALVERIQFLTNHLYERKITVTDSAKMTAASVPIEGPCAQAIPSSTRVGSLLKDLNCQADPRASGCSNPPSSNDVLLMNAESEGG